MVRPSLGHESEAEWGFYGFPQAGRSKKVWVIGGGLAGMQTAAIAAEKGHAVTLSEQSERLGGQAATAARGPWGDEEFMRLVDYLKRYCERGGVKFEMGKRVTAKEIQSSDADHIVVATGATPRSAVKGADGEQVVSCLDVMDGRRKPREKVAILGSGGVAIATALYLLDQGGYNITLVHEGKKPGADVNPSYIWRYMSKLKEGHVVQVAFAKPKEISAKGVVVETPEGERLIEAETVILAHMHSANDLGQARKGVYVIGDALRPRRGNSAVLDGYKMGMRL
jgi:NADPH-dependent 2,4-dienoyl-CoA reductase/sulfur reductase-like enzyme